MEWLNYHHLFYFWRVATLGSISAAAQELRLRQPTVSAQIASLEVRLGRKLFDRSSRKIVLTEDGRIAQRYAEQIFAVGRELVNHINERPIGRPIEFAIGVVDVVPKLVAYKILEPVFRFSQPTRLQCHEDDASTLLALMANHELDLVVSDAPIPSNAGVRGFNHLIGRTEIGFFAKSAVAKRLRRRFPESLNGQKLLVPLTASVLRRRINQWLDEIDVQPEIVGEFDDSALMKRFGESGEGIFPAPIAIASDIERVHKVKLISPVPYLVEEFYAISPERRIRNPIVDAIVERGGQLFSPVRRRGK